MLKDMGALGEYAERFVCISVGEYADFLCVMGDCKSILYAHSTIRQKGFLRDLLICGNWKV